MKDYSKPYTTPYYDELKRQGISMPCFMGHIRTDQARMEKPNDARMFRMLFLTQRTDGCCGTIDTRPNTNLIMSKVKRDIYMEYHENPTKEDLIEYFGQRIKIRKMTPREAFRLMDVDDADIDKIINATVEVPLKDGTKKAVKAISKTACYKLAGNSIVVSCLYHIFRILLIPGQTENAERGKQLSIF